MKKNLIGMVMLAGLLTWTLVASVHAWEINMKAEHEWTYQYFDQSGPNGFFGTFNTPARSLAPVSPIHSNELFGLGPGT